MLILPIEKLNLSSYYNIAWNTNRYWCEIYYTLIPAFTKSSTTSLSVIAVTATIAKFISNSLTVFSRSL